MANPGILLTSALTTTAGVLFILAADAIRIRRTFERRDNGVVYLFFVVLGTMLLVAGVREAIAWWGQDHAGWLAPDRALYFLSCMLAAAAIVPLAQLVAQVFLGPRFATWVITYVFSGLALVGILLLFEGGVSGPVTDAWGSDWHIESDAVILLIIVAAVLPGLWAMFALAWHARRLHDGDRHRVWAVAGACALYVSVLALGAVGVPGAWVLVERAAYMVAGWASWSAYRGTHATSPSSAAIPVWR